MTGTFRALSSLQTLTYCFELRSQLAAEHVALQLLIREVTASVQVLKQALGPAVRKPHCFCAAVAFNSLDALCRVLASILKNLLIN